MFKSTEAEFEFYRALTRAENTVRRTIRNAWMNGVGHGHSAEMLQLEVRYEVQKLIIQESHDFSGHCLASLCEARLLDAMHDELDLLQATYK